MSWDAVLLTETCPTPGDQKAAVAAWPEPLVELAGVWSTELITTTGSFRCFMEEPWLADDPEDVEEYVGPEAAARLPVPVWWTDLSSPASGGREGVGLITTICSVLVDRCGGVWYDPQEDLLNFAQDS